MTTIARPYAIAAFEFASAKNTLKAWEAMLDLASQLTQDVAVQQLLMDPRLAKRQLVDFYYDMLANDLDDDRKNFIALLAENQRFIALPDITMLFKSYRAAQEKKMTVKVVSAVNLDQAFQQKLTDVLSHRFKQQVTLKCSVDENLLGGAIITAGDTVIDGSVRGKLNRMVEFISEIS